MAMQGESTEEVTAFLRAVLDPLPASHRIYWESRILVAESAEAARSCIGLAAKVVIVIADADPDWQAH
jgi:hypothetical protein